MTEPSPAADADLTDRLKSTLWYYIGQLVDEETINLGVNVTPQYIGSLTELAWAQLANTATDLEAFARHAGRTQIKANDALLLARRNEGLESILNQEAEMIRKEAEKNKKNKEKK